MLVINGVFCTAINEYIIELLSIQIFVYKSYPFYNRLDIYTIYKSIVHY